MKVILFSRDFANRLHTAAELSVNSLKWTDKGGCEGATITAIGTAEDLYQLSAMGRCPVEIYDDFGQCVWWGYVSELMIGGRGYSWGWQIDTMVNKAAVAYSLVEPNTESTGVRATTAFASDATSIAEFGTKEALARGGDMSASAAEQQRDTALAASKYPQGIVQFGGGEQVGILTFAGWFSTLDWRLASWAAVVGVSATAENADQNIGDAAGSTSGMQQITIGSQALNVLTAWVYLRKSGTPADNLTVEIFAMDLSGNPTGSALSSGTLAGGSITTSNAWVSVTMSEANLDAYGWYALVVRRSGANDAGNYYIWRVSTALGYGGGAFKLWNGSAWVARGTDADATFQLLVNNNVMGGRQLSELVSTYGQFIVSQAYEISWSDTPLLPSYRDGDTTALTEILALMDAGTINDRNIICQVDKSRRLIWREAPASTTITYYLHQDGRITDASGAMVTPYMPEVGVWVQLADIPSTADTSLLIDASRQYMQGAEWSLDGGLKPIFRGDAGVDVFGGGSANLGEMKSNVLGWVVETGSYVPDWTGATTYPAIGNGTLGGTYVAAGPMVDVYIRMAAGSTTTFGSGTWVFRLPFPANTATDAYWFGEATVYDASAGTFNAYGVRLESYNPYIMVFFTASSTLNFNATSPITWATSDELYMHVRYRRK